MTSTRPPSGTVHPDVSADAGNGELFELTDDEVLREFREASADVASSGEGLDDGAETRSVEESGAWVAYSEPPPAPAPVSAADKPAKEK